MAWRGEYERLKALAERGLAAALKPLKTRRQSPSPLNEAIVYAVTSGGKRLRPVLALHAATLAGGRPQDALCDLSR